MIIERERQLFILNEIYSELSVVVQASYNMLGSSSDAAFERHFDLFCKFLDKLHLVKDITKEEISYISDNMDGLYIQYTDYREGGHGNTGRIERRLYMRTPSIQNAWKEFFTKSDSND